MDSQSYIASPPLTINVTVWFLQFQENTHDLEVEYYQRIKEREADSRIEGYI